MFRVKGIWIRFLLIEGDEEMKFGVSKIFKCDRAAVLPLFALTLFPILFLTGAVIDIGRQAYINTQLAYACDAAAIAGARYDVDDVVANATKIFYANFPKGTGNLNVVPVVTLSADNSTVTVTASANTALIFSKLLKLNTLPVAGETVVLRQLLSSQIAMVLDVTGSMAYNAKIQGLRAAASQLVSVIAEGSSTLPTNTAISIVPFVATVNVGSQYTGWLSDPATVTNRNNFPRNSPWAGCVGAVDTGNTMDTDTPPSASRKWPTYFAASTHTLYPSSSNRRTQTDNDWTVSGNNVSVVTPISGVNIGPNRSCGPAILPLTNDVRTLNSKINSLQPTNGGGTFGNLGLVWGWNTISPKWIGKWNNSIDPTPYGNGNSKSLIIVTDGENQWYDQPSYAPNGDPTAYGFQSSTNRLSTNLLGTTSLSSSGGKINSRVLSVCNSIKAAGIQVFTVTFRVSSSSAISLYRQCASKPEWAYQANNSQDLYNQFTAIGNQVKKITIFK